MIKFKIRDISFICDEETGICNIKGAGENIVMNNPIEAFNTFWQMAGTALLLDIKDAIEKNGFNRYTGAKNGKKDVV